MPRPSPLGATLAAVLVLAAGCSRSIAPAVEDAQLVVRVKTAIVNDRVLGPREIGVQASRGAIRLTGSVESEAEVQQAMALARSVDGVREVTSELRVQPPAPTQAVTRRYRPNRTGGATEEETWPSMVAIGASLSFSRPGDAVGTRVSGGPQLAWGPAPGFGTSIGFSWFGGDLRTADGGDSFGKLRVRPIMAGVSYTVVRDRLFISPSLVGGIAFNSFSIDETLTSDLRAVDVDNSLAARLGVGVGYRLNRRVSITGFVGRVVVRPQVTYVDPGGVFKRSVNADTTQLSVGFAYWIF